MDKSLFFDEPKEVFSGRDRREFVFPFRVVDTALIGAPEEESQSKHYKVKVDVSRTLETCWGLDEGNLIKVMYEYGKRHVVQKLKDGTLGDREELFLSTYNTEQPCPFNPERIEQPAGASVRLETEGEIMDQPGLLQLAGAIIDARDNINALFHQRNGEKLLLLGEERDLLQFFRSATTPEEFFFRLCALTNAAIHLNINCLRSLTGNTNKDDKSITLLEQYLRQEGKEDTTIINTLRAINKLRQGYPVHGDRSKGVIDAHAHFGLVYPVVDYAAAWRILLNHYLDALTRLLDKLKG